MEDEERLAGMGEWKLGSSRILFASLVFQQSFIRQVADGMASDK